MQHGKGGASVRTGDRIEWNGKAEDRSGGADAVRDGTWELASSGNPSAVNVYKISENSLLPLDSKEKKQTHASHSPLPTYLPLFAHSIMLQFPLGLSSHKKSLIKFPQYLDGAKQTARGIQPTIE